MVRFKDCAWFILKRQLLVQWVVCDKQNVTLIQLCLVLESLMRHGLQRLQKLLQAEEARDPQPLERGRWESGIKIGQSVLVLRLALFPSGLMRTISIGWHITGVLVEPCCFYVLRQQITHCLQLIIGVIGTLGFAKLVSHVWSAHCSNLGMESALFSTYQNMSATGCNIVTTQVSLNKVGKFNTHLTISNFNIHNISKIEWPYTFDVLLVLHCMVHWDPEPCLCLAWLARHCLDRRQCFQ